MKRLAKKVDVDESPELAREYNVMSVPTLISFKDGKVSSRASGAMPKSEVLNLVK